MKSMINNIALITVFTALGFFSASAKEYGVNANAFSNSLKTVNQHLKNSPVSPRSPRTTKAKTELGQNTMCLAMDLFEVKLTIEDAIIEPEYEADAKESIDLLLFHLEGTAEGDKLNKLLASKTASMADYKKVVAEVERSLQTRYSGEQRWAFTIGLAISNVVYESVYGSEKGFFDVLNRLAAFVEKTEGFASEQEIEILNRIAVSTDKKVWKIEDYNAFEKDMIGFIKLYFDEA